MRYRLGVDVGGTFTDVLPHDREQQRMRLAKAPSTRGDQSVGVIDGIRLAADRASIAPADLDAMLHGTTVAANAVLERRGAARRVRPPAWVPSGWRHVEPRR